MKTKDIIKGRRYTHKKYPKTTYLGSRNNRGEPQMVVVHSLEYPHIEGNVVDAKNKSFWQGFSLIG